MMDTQDKIAANYIPTAAAGRCARIPASLAGLRLDVVLARLFPEISRSRLQVWMKDGLVKVDGNPANPRRKTWGGELVEVAPDSGEASGPDTAEAIALQIVHEDPCIIIIDKPVGLVVHPGSGNRSGTLLNALLHHAPQLAALPRAGIVHRLDKDTSGLLVVAKTLEAQTDLVRQLQARTVKRHYLALVHGRVPRDGSVEAPIGRHPVQRIRMAVTRGGKDARTWYTVRERFDNSTLLECKLDTGRTHQIRVHMASIEHPLVGDATYGKRKCGDPLLDAFPRQALHAARLGLIHPATHDELQWESLLPADFTALLAGLRERAS